MSAKVIMVEGVTDAFLLSRLFIDVANYSPATLERCAIHANPDLSRCEGVEYLLSPHRETLLIFACGTCSRFHGCYEKYFKTNALNGKISRLAIVRDADKKTQRQLESDINNAFENRLIFNHCSWRANQLVSNEFGLDERHEMETYLKIIPSTKKGVLEDALLDAIKLRGKDDKIVVELSECHVRKLKQEQNKYIKTERMERKAVLSTAFAAFEPSHAFQKTESFFKSIRWKNFPKVVELFDDMLKI